MTPRRCLACGRPLGATDTYCRVCGHIELPLPQDRLERMSLWSLAGLVLLVIFGVIGLIALVLLGLEWLL